jgi:hypothetical protein
MSVVFHESHGSPPGSPIQNAVDRLAHSKATSGRFNGRSAGADGLRESASLAGIELAETPQASFYNPAWNP